VPVDLKTNEWNSLRDQFRALVHNEGISEDIEQLLDAQIRRRFGELIARAKGLGQAQRHIEVPNEHEG
jgi:hypothetical protein